MKPGTAVFVAAMALASAAVAQPTITSLGSGSPVSVTRNGGVDYVSSANARWMLNGGALSYGGIAGATGGGMMSADGNFVVVTVPNDVNQVSGNTATGVTPAFSTTPTLVSAPIATTEQGAAVWDASTNTLKRLGGLPIVPELMVYGSGSSGSSSGSFVSPLNISSNGRFVVGQAYISSYSNATGTTISNNTFQWRAFVWDSQANGGAGGYTVLPTPFRTSTNTWRRRTGSAMCVSADGTVIAGAQEHNAAGGAGPDPDGGRPVVWRWNAGTSSYDMTFLPNGMDGSGNFYTTSISGGSMLMNSAGTIIVGPAIDNSGSGYIGKWVWNAGTSSWNAPVAVVPQMATPASWLPGAVTGCGIPPSLGPTAMTEDASIIVGQARYSTCGSFMSGGFIWHEGDGGVTRDWYDYLVQAGTPGVADYYGPVGDNGDPTRGLPRLGFPRSITADGSVIVGFQGGNQLIPGAAPTIVHMTGGPACVAPVITSHPNNLMYSRCSIGTTVSTITLSGGVAGTLPISFQWSKDGNVVTDGMTANGSIVTGSSTFVMRITNAGPADSGSYRFTATGCGGATATSNVATVQNDPTIVAPVNDTCETAMEVGEGTFNFNICGAYTASGVATCTPSTVAESGDVWYRYTPTFTGNARFQTCGSAYDTVLQLSDGCGGQLYDCNNDVGSRGLVGTTCSSTRSVIASYPVAEGQAIYVRVAALSFPSATGALTISQAPTPPANDFCWTATPASIGTFPFDLSAATDDYTFGTDFCTSGQTATTSNRDVWFRLSTPCELGGTYTISTCGSTITNPMLHVFDSCNGNILACHDNVGSGVAGCTSNQARISDLTVSGPVLIRVSASGTSAPNSGLGQIVITGTDNACGPVCGSSDYNGDGDFGTDADIEAFFACLAGQCCPTCWQGESDFNGDGDFGTDADIEAFFRVLAGQPC